MILWTIETFAVAAVRGDADRQVEGEVGAARVAETGLALVLADTVSARVVGIKKCM
jgi:hypothetical protein